ncbi:MAG: hypothetical protein IT437_09425 [Phycisphaerales bacterium]|nr:hypothetical protein [Phycisphaerales bacterium]
MKRVVATALLAAAVPALGQSVRVETDATGTYIRPSRGLMGPTAPSPEAMLWTYNHPTAIPQSVSLSPASGSAWVGQTLNAEMLQRFAITGSGVPTMEIPAGGNSPCLVSAAQNADIAAFLDHTGSNFEVRAYASTSSTPLWTFSVPAQYDNYGGPHNLKVSRDGSVVAAGFNISAGGAPILYFLNGSTGAVINTYTQPSGFIASVDLTDSGGLCVIQHTTTQALAKVIDTATGTETFSVPGTGAGTAYFKISGNGDVIVVGGFSFHVYKKIAGVYTQIINFSAPTSWFGSAAVVSRDGSTVGALNHNYGTNYQDTSTRIWDVNSAALLGTFNTHGSGSLQGSASDAAMSDDGSKMVAAHWGTQDNAFPETLVFDRSVNLINQIDSPGSPFSVDMSGNGQYVLVGAKSVHANIMGNGGNTYLLSNAVACYPDCNGDAALNLSDFGCFTTKFALGDPYADCNSDSVLNLSDFGCFTTKFALGCP